MKLDKETEEGKVREERVFKESGHEKRCPDGLTIARAYSPGVATTRSSG